MLILHTALSPSLSLSLNLPLSHSLSLSLSRLHTHTEMSTHMLFRIPASHSQPLFCLALPHVFLSSSILKGDVTCTTHFSCLARTLTWTFLSCCRFWTVVWLCRWASNGWHLHWSLEDQSGGKKFNLGKVIIWHWFHWCNGSWTGRRDLNQMQRKVEIRGIPKHVEMLFGKTAYAYSVAEM